MGNDLKEDDRRAILRECAEREERRVRSLSTDEWKAEYKARLIECGLPEEDAEACTQAVDYVDELIADGIGPRESADEELFYMAQDSE